MRRQFVPSAVAVAAQAEARRAFKDAALGGAGQWGMGGVGSVTRFGWVNEPCPSSELVLPDQV